MGKLPAGDSVRSSSPARTAPYSSSAPLTRSHFADGTDPTVACSLVPDAARTGARPARHAAALRQQAVCVRGTVQRCSFIKLAFTFDIALGMLGLVERNVALIVWIAIGGIMAVFAGQRFPVSASR